MVQKLKELLFTNAGTRQTVVKNIVWLSVGQVGSRLIRAIIIIYAARILGAAEYGVFSYVLGLAGFFTVFADVGVTSILTREVAKKPEESGRYFATVFWMKFALLALTALAIIFVAPHFSKIEAALPLIPFVAILAIADGLREFGNAFFRAKEKMELEALVTTTTNVVITGAGFAALAYSATAGALTASYVLSAAAGAFVSIFILRREFSTILRSFAHELVRPIAKAAIPMALITLVGAFMLNVDLVMLGWWRSASDVGFYSAAQKIVQVLYTISGIVSGAIFPALARFIGQGLRDKERALLERALGIVFLIAVPLAVGGVLLASPIISFLYGADYAPSAFIFQILILTVLVVFPGAFFGNFIFAHDQHGKLAPAIFGVSVLNVGLNFILIPPFGIMGAAVATISSQTLYNGFMWWRSRRILDFKILPYLTRIVSSAAIMAGAVFLSDLVGLHVVFSIAIGAAVYLASLHLLRDALLSELLSVIKRRGLSVE